MVNWIIQQVSQSIMVKCSYVVENSGHRISVFHCDGQFSHIIGSGRLRYAWYVGVSNDQLLVANASHNCISIFTLDGNYVGKYDTRGTGRKQLDSPYGIDIDMYGFIFVTEHSENRVSIFNKDGVFVHSFGFGLKGSGHGQLFGPRGIAISPTGEIYVCDTNNKRIQIFST